MSDSLQSWYQPTVRTCYKKAWSHYCSLLALSGQVHLVLPCRYTMSTPFLCFPSPASHSQGLAWRILQFQHSTLSFCIRTSLSSCPNCSFPLVNHGHVVVVFLFLKLLIWTCCLCLHHWTQECFPIPMSGCVVSHAPSLRWKPGHVCWMGDAACLNKLSHSDDQEMRAPRYAAEQVSTDAATVSQLSASSVPGLCPIFHTQSSLSSPHPANIGFCSLLWDKLSKFILPEYSILIPWSNIDVSSFKPHLCFLLAPLPCFLLLVLDHDPFQLLTIANSR